MYKIYEYNSKGNYPSTCECRTLDGKNIIAWCTGPQNAYDLETKSIPYNNVIVLGFLKLIK